MIADWKLKNGLIFNIQSAIVGGSSSIGRVSAFQAEGCGFEARLPLWLMVVIPSAGMGSEEGANEESPGKGLSTLHEEFPRSVRNKRSARNDGYQMSVAGVAQW